MRKLIMWNLITLDGYFEGAKSWELDWHNDIWGEELDRISIEQLRSADMLIFGRITYEGMAAYWRTAKGEAAEWMNKLPKVVFSRTIKATDWANTTLIHDHGVSVIRKLKPEGSGNLFVFDSGNLSATFIREGLFDEYRLLITPVILGSGNPLFGRGLRRQGLQLIESKQLISGGVILRYVNK